MKKILILCSLCLLFTSCFEDADDNIVATTTINDFIWKAMNTVYLYNDTDILSDTKFGLNGISNRYDFTQDYSDFLNSYATPEDLFNDLVDDSRDSFSVIVPDYIAVVNQQQGVSLSNGLSFFIDNRPDATNNEVYAVIRMVLNNSEADNLGLQRGQFITAVDGVTLTQDNFIDLLTQTTYTLNFADYNQNNPSDPNDDTLTLNGTNETLTAVVFTDNPVHRVETLSVSGQTIGYLMYNGFTSNFDSQLNTAFAQLQSANIDELVLDLRYNGGGAIQTAAYLASMINNQNVGNVFSKLVFNAKFQSENRDFLFTNTIDGGIAINSINNLQRLIVLTSDRTASASELIINSLQPYMEVVVIGDTTVGKTEANRLVLDSPDFGGTNINVTHTYGLIPLIANSVNRDGMAVSTNGIVPNIVIEEEANNLGTLGDANEPLLAEAIAYILGNPSPDRFNPTSNINLITVDAFKTPFSEMMFE